MSSSPDNGRSHPRRPMNGTISRSRTARTRCRSSSCAEPRRGADTPEVYPAPRSPISACLRPEQPVDGGTRVGFRLRRRVPRPERLRGTRTLRPGPSAFPRRASDLRRRATDFRRRTRRRASDLGRRPRKDRSSDDGRRPNRRRRIDHGRRHSSRWSRGRRQRLRRSDDNGRCDHRRLRGDHRRRCLFRPAWGFRHRRRGDAGRRRDRRDDGSPDVDPMAHLDQRTEDEDQREGCTCGDHNIRYPRA